MSTRSSSSPTQTASTRLASRHRSPSPTRRTAAAVASSPPPAPLQPVSTQRHHEDEFEGPHSFGGVVGTLFLVFFLPAIILGLKIFCEKEFCFEELNLARAAAAIPTDLSAYFSWQVTGVYFAFVAYMACCERFLPAKIVDGLPLRDGTRLSYRLNGHLTFWFTILLLDHWHHFNFTSASLAWVYDHYLHLATISIVSAFALSLYLYFASFQAHGAHLALAGNTRYPTYDFFMGRELNPRFGKDFDIKLFVEMRIGLVGWVVLDLAMLFKQAELNGGTVSSEMLLVVFFQLVYVWDSLYLEHALLSTLDVTTEGLGYMLTFGDMVWIPFGFSVQARYLVDHSPGLSSLTLAAIVVVYALGYWIFRGANSQKDMFRTDPTNPKVAHLQSMRTKRGTNLLTSGFWGAARKINYTGDLLIALAFCLPCGFSTPVPYFYFIYLFSLLMHRAWRDDAACAQKYGEDWERYKKAVPKIFIPYVI